MPNTPSQSEPHDSSPSSHPPVAPPSISQQPPPPPQKPPLPSQAINNTRSNRYLTRLAKHTTARRYPRYGTCIQLSSTRILKTGLAVGLTEATTMAYIAEHTSIPVPKVHCSFIHRGRGHIVMEKIEGDMVGNVWRDMDDKTRKSICSQLKAMVDELRTLKPPEGMLGVASTTKGSLIDTRLPRPLERFGPFDTMKDFHEWLRDGLRLETFEAGAEHACSDEDWEQLKKMVERQDSMGVEWGSDLPVFTHADLNPANILVRGGKVVGIIDWQFSGWYPGYWEYTSAYLTNVMREYWVEALELFLDKDEKALEMERVRQRWWGEF